MDNDEKILERLEELRDSKGALPESVELCRKLLDFQAEAKKVVPGRQGAVGRADAARLLHQGLPLLAWENLSLDWSAFRHLFTSVISIIGESCEDASGDLQRIGGLTADCALLAGAARAWYDWSPLSPWSDPLGVSDELLSNVMCLAFRPWLITCAGALSELVVQEKWRRGYCPICGGKPDFALLDKEQGARWLLCWRCDTQWLFQRLQCPYCETRNQDVLAYFSDVDGVYRIYVCEECHGYLKAIDARRVDSEILLPLERVFTTELDRQALGDGYRADWIAPQRAEQT